MSKVFILQRPVPGWYMDWDGTNFDELVAQFPQELGPYFSVDQETQAFVFEGQPPFPLGSHMTFLGGVTSLQDSDLERFQVVSSERLKFDTSDDPVVK